MLCPGLTHSVSICHESCSGGSCELSVADLRVVPCLHICISDLNFSAAHPISGLHKSCRVYYKIYTHKIPFEYLTLSQHYLLLHIPLLELTFTSMAAQYPAISGALLRSHAAAQKRQHRRGQRAWKPKSRAEWSKLYRPQTLNAQLVNPDKLRLRP